MRAGAPLVFVAQGAVVGPGTHGGERLVVLEDVGPGIVAGRAGLRIVEVAGHVVDRGESARVVGLHLAVLVVRLDLRVGRIRLQELGIETQRSIRTLGVIVGRLLTVQGLVVHQVDSGRQFIRNEDLVVIERLARRTEGAVADLHVALVGKHRLVGRGVRDTRGAADAEQERIRATGNIHAADVVPVPRNIAGEVVAGVVHRGQTARTIGAGRVDQPGRFRGARDVHARTTIRQA